MFIRRAFQNNLPILRTTNHVAFGMSSMAAAHVRDIPVLTHIENQIETKFEVEPQAEINAAIVPDMSEFVLKMNDMDTNYKTI